MKEKTVSEEGSVEGLVPEAVLSHPAYQHTSRNSEPEPVVGRLIQELNELQSLYWKKI